MANLKVIGTGFGRTGTDSMREALDILGLGPCHHMRSLIADKTHRDHWRAFIAGGRCDWDILLGTAQSCVDWPTAHYWPQLIKAFPDAKVLLTWRTPESWWNSFSKTILPIVEETYKKPNNPPGSQLIATEVFANKPMTRDHCIATYIANVQRVQSTVPADRLLTYKIGDGWDPLCEHLGVPVPNQPFPHANSSTQFNSKGDFKA